MEKRMIDSVSKLLTCLAVETKNDLLFWKTIDTSKDLSGFVPNAFDCIAGKCPEQVKVCKNFYPNTYFEDKEINIAQFQVSKLEIETIDNKHTLSVYATDGDCPIIIFIPEDNELISVMYQEKEDL